MNKWSKWYTIYLCTSCDTEQWNFGAGHTCSTCGKTDSVAFVGQRHKLTSPWWRFWNRTFEIERKNKITAKRR